MMGLALHSTPTMNTFHLIEPEVAGDLGEASVLDHSTQPYSVSRLQYEFNVPPEDDLLTTHPCFVVTERLRAALHKLAGTGYRFEDLEITTTEDFDELYPDIKLPRYFWMKVDGVPGVDDTGLSDHCTLVVSDRFLEVLRDFAMSNCVVRRKPFRPKR